MKKVSLSKIHYPVPNPGNKNPVSPCSHKIPPYLVSICIGSSVSDNILKHLLHKVCISIFR